MGGPRARQFHAFGVKLMRNGACPEAMGKERLFYWMGWERETVRLMARNQLVREFCIKTIDRSPDLL
jgi:hypothetical protein